MREVREYEQQVLEREEKQQWLALEPALSRVPTSRFLLVLAPLYLSLVPWPFLRLPSSLAAGDPRYWCQPLWCWGARLGRERLYVLG